MNIRAQYADVLSAINQEYNGSGYSEDYVLSKDVSSGQCIGYATRYIAGGEYKHYRYNRYQSLLMTAMKEMPLETSQPLLHLDIGAGPGLFTWVLRDYARQHFPNISLELYGYDHAPNMAKLANLLWQRFDETVDYTCFHDIDELKSAVMFVDHPAQVLLTFGHVLIQVYQQENTEQELRKFAGLCDDITKRDSEPRLVAIDAHTGSRPKLFAEAWSKLESLLSGSYKVVVYNHDKPSQNIARITAGDRH